VKLAPKKATVAASAGERKLMAELEAMKELVEQLKKQNQATKRKFNDNFSRTFRTSCRTEFMP
jgi:cell shape-determining protein MreC